MSEAIPEALAVEVRFTLHDRASGVYNSTVDTQELLRDLFRAAFMHMREQVKNRGSQNDVAKAAIDAFNQVHASVIPVTWETATRTSVQGMRTQAALCKPVRLVGFITERTQPMLETVGKLDGGTEDVEVITAVIEDRHRESIATTCLTGRALIEEIQNIHREGAPVELLGVSIALPVSQHSAKRQFFFHVVDIRRSLSHLDMIGATDAERRQIGNALDAYRRQGKKPLDLYLNDVVDDLGVSGVEHFPLLRNLLEFTALQALSTGNVSSASGRLHLLVVGPPGQGKKLVGLAAKSWNPTCVEISAAKATPAGLIGSSHRGNQGWVSSPGALARAAHGVAVLQDAHAWKTSDLARIAPILQELIEDGVVRDTVAGGVTRAAPVSLVIDLNRTAQVGMSGRTEAAILRLRPLLSRVDVIAEIPDDADRAWRVAEKMYDKITGGGAGPMDQGNASRERQVLVAALKDRNPVIDLAPVREAMRQTHVRVWQANEARLANMPEAGDIPARLAISFARLVCAIARAADRNVAAVEDVSKAAEFIEMKLNFLRLHGAQPAPATEQPRSDWVREHALQPISPEELAAGYERDTGNAVNVKTIRRDLEQLGAKKKARGKYYVPALHQAEGTKEQKDIGTSASQSPVTGEADAASLAPSTRMYKDAETWNPFKGCGFGCAYCEPSFQRQAKRQKNNCSRCYKYEPHEHKERLVPADIPRSSIVFVCGNADIAFCKPAFVHKILDVIEQRNKKYPNTIYYLQSKKPECFKPFLARLPKNVVLVTTLETNRNKGYRAVSKAPSPTVRYRKFLALKYPFKVVTIEPVMDFDLEEFSKWIIEIAPEYVWLGYNSKPAAVQLAEPTPAKLARLVKRLRAAGIEVRGKELRGHDVGLG